jgi:hypothetical protein
VPVQPNAAEVPDPEQMVEDMKKAVQRVRVLVAHLKDVEEDEKTILPASYFH